jgi:hypothetical protein
MHAVRHLAGSLPALTLVVLAFGGCGAEQSISDSKLAAALDLEQGSGAYRVDGDPFCTVDELLNDADEVESASGSEGSSFLIASPDGEVGVLARRPFAPDCTQKAKDALKRLARASE